MRISRLPLLLAAALLAATSSVLLASGPSFWTVATSSDFLKGTSEGVYVSLSGTLTAGPELTNRLTSTPAQIWSLAEGADGVLWAGTGGDGRVIRLRQGQPEETVFDAEENNVFAIATSGSRVFAATSPDGKVYVIEGDSPARVFFDPTETYIWALAADAEGRLWVGAGNPAVLYRVAPDGASQVLYRPPAAHVVSLGIDSTGRLLAGTESPGRLYRFDQQDRPFVLLDSGLAELRAISPHANGTVFVAAVAQGDAPSGSGETPSVAVTLASATPSRSGSNGSTSSGSSTSTSTSTSGSDSASSSSSTAATRRSALFRIDPDGTWEEIWSTADLVYDVKASDDGGVLLATGPAGRLYKVERSLDVLLLTGVDAKQITRFAATSAASPLPPFATANPGRVVSAGPGVQTPARFVSHVQDTKSVATWGQIRWESTGPVTLYTRSGNTERPDDSWSEWAGPYTERMGEVVTSPAARFVQWRADFGTAASAPAAALSAVTLAYLPRNNRPTVTSITVHPPGVVFQRPFVNDESAIAGLDPATAEARRPPGDPPTPAAPGRRMFQKGLQSIAWRAEDSDGDRLEYALQYRREDDSTWRDLRSNLSDGIFVWDTTTVADGRYVVRVSASDHPTNVGERALAGERESAIVSIDNTPPALTIARQAGPPARLDVHVVDSRSPIQKVEYSVAGGAWQLVYPLDGLADSPDERYEIPLRADADVTRIVIRATDLLQNVVSQPAAGPERR
jgi:hypothetical protein